VIDWLPWALTAASGLSGLVVGYRLGRGRADETEAESLREELATARRESRRLRQLAQESQVSPPSSGPSPTTPLEYGRLIGQLGSLTSVRSAGVVDEEGLPLTAMPDDDAARAASCASLLTRLEAYQFIGLLRFEAGVDHFRIQRLPSGAWLFTHTRGVALGDGTLAVAFAPFRLELSALSSAPALVAPAGPTQHGPLASELGRMLGSSELRLAALRDGEGISFAGEAFDAEVLDRTFKRLGVLNQALDHFAAATVQRIDFAGRDGRHWTFVPSACLLVAADDAFAESLVLERMCGRIRRLARTQTVARTQELPLAV